MALKECENPFIVTVLHRYKSIQSRLDFQGKINKKITFLSRGGCQIFTSLLFSILNLTLKIMTCKKWHQKPSVCIYSAHVQSDDQRTSKEQIQLPADTSTFPMTACGMCQLTANCSLHSNHDPGSKVWTLTFSAASRLSDRWRRSFVYSRQIVHFTHTHRNSLLTQGLRAEMDRRSPIATVTWSPADIWLLESNMPSDSLSVSFWQHSI